jgi:hypothetical protein
MKDISAGGSTAARQPARWAPGFDHVWLAALLAATWGVVNGFPVDQTDYWWTVKLGDALWATGQLPTTNTLAVTPVREPYVEQQWLAQLILAATHRAGGLHAALLLRAVSMTAAMWLVYAACRRAGVGTSAAGVATLAALLLAFPGAATRPQLLALPLFALFLAATVRAPGQPWTLVALPLAMVLWVNLHGSFPLGLGLVGVALLGRLWELRWEPGALGDGSLRRLALLLGLCGAAIFCNPYGLGIVPWLADFLTLHTGGKEAAVMATEWMPTSIREQPGLYYFASVALLASLLVRVGPPPPADGLRLLAFGFLALTTIRSTTWWGLAHAPTLAWALAALGAKRVGALAAPRRDRPLLHTALNALCLLTAVLGLPGVRGALAGQEVPIADPRQPRRAAEYLAGLATPLRLFNALDWGGYLGWRLGPRHQLYIDGRLGIYVSAVFRDYWAISGGRPGWAERLQAYGMDAIVASRDDQPDLVEALAQQAGWRPAYCDEQAVVYLRPGLTAGREVPCAAVR